MALPIIARDVIVDPEQKRELFKHWYPPSNPGSTVNGGIDLVAAIPANTPDPGTTATLADGTTVRGITRDLLNIVSLPLPAGEATRVPGANATNMWVIGAPGVVTYPSKTVRVVENDITQANLSGKNGTHTIHWHGIEPTPMNDGVGKQSFELSAFKYQWAANQAGTYFYHCHKNTVLHFEMGLFGLLIVDPKGVTNSLGQAPPFTDGGPGVAMVADTVPGSRKVNSFTGPVSVIDYDAECLWVVDDIDTFWHTLSVTTAMANNFAPLAGAAVDDPTNPALFTHGGPLNDFRPDIFCITGKVQAGARTSANPTPLTGAPVSATVQAGRNVYARILNASYCTCQFTLEVDALVVGMDGRPLGVRVEGKYNRPFVIPAGRPFRYGTARRWDLLITPKTPGIYKMKCEFFSMNHGIKLGTAVTQITAT